MKEVVMDDDKIKMPIPGTVGEMIEFLKKFPKDRKLDLYYIERNDYGSDYETSAYHMEVQELQNYGSVEITIK